MTRAWAFSLAAIFLLAFVVRALYATDLAPLMYLPQQPGTRMTARYEDVALRILRGEGILYPRDADPTRTGLIARPPGYSMYLAAIYGGIARSRFAAQLVQNGLTSLCCVLLALGAARFLRRGVAVLAGIIAALSPHLGFASCLVLPDALSALPLLVALLLLAVTHADRGRGPGWSLAAGVVLGAGAWLRPNVVLLPPFLAVVLVLIARRRRQAFRDAACLALAAAAVIAPITLRNWIVFRELVLISTNGGLTFWQGVAEAGGREHGGFRRDKLVMAEEARRYGNPRYADWWAEPDGIWRDRERYRRGWEVVWDHPLAYARVMLERMAGMVDYDSGLAPFVALPGERPPRLPDVDDDGEPDAPPSVQERHRTGERFLVGHRMGWLRWPIRQAQELVLPALRPLVLVGIVVVLAAGWRSGLLLLAIPLYYFLTESFFILEWRVVVPMHYTLFAAAAAAVGVVVDAVAEGYRRIRSR